MTTTYNAPDPAASADAALVAATHAFAVMALRAGDVKAAEEFAMMASEWHPTPLVRFFGLALELLTPGDLAYIADVCAERTEPVRPWVAALASAEAR